jgi:hypothetical protein
MELPRRGLGLTEEVLYQLHPDNVRAVLPEIGQVVPHDVDPITLEAFEVDDIVVGYYNHGTIIYMSVDSFQRQLRTWKQSSAPVDMYRNNLYNADGPLAFVGLYQVTSRLAKRLKNRVPSASEVVDLASDEPADESHIRSKSRPSQPVARTTIRRYMRSFITKMKSTKKAKKKADHKEKKRLRQAERQKDDDIDDAALEAAATLNTNFGIEIGEVEGDGNCFYGAIYGAAKNHPDGSLVPQIVAAMGHEAREVSEKQFVRYLRDAIAARVRAGEGYDFDMLYGFSTGDADAYRLVIADMSANFRAKFRRDVFRKKFTENTPENRRRFFAEFADIIEQDKVWATQTENDIATRMLAAIGIDLHTVGIAPTDGRMVPDHHGRRQLWLFKPGGAEHYEYFKWPS